MSDRFQKKLFFPLPALHPHTDISMKNKLMIAIGLCSAVSINPLMATPAEMPETGIPKGLGVQLKTDCWNVETLDKAYSLGFKIVRRGFYWNAVEKERGVYDFSAFQKEMEHAKKRNLTVIACLFGGNSLYNETKGGILTQAGREGFARFAAAAAKQYAGQDVIFEIWNEPNVRTFWRKDGTHNSKPYADEYSALVNTAVPAMLKADPNCRVVAGSVSNYWQPSYEWTEFCFQNGRLVRPSLWRSQSRRSCNRARRHAKTSGKIRRPGYAHRQYRTRLCGKGNRNRRRMERHRRR